MCRPGFLGIIRYEQMDTIGTSRYQHKSFCGVHTRMSLIIPASIAVGYGFGLEIAYVK